jgi:hypothetical protein
MAERIKRGPEEKQNTFGDEGLKMTTWEILEPSGWSSGE